MANQAPTNAELAQQIANLTNVVANLAQAIGTGGAAGAGGAGGAPSFATSPGVADVDQLIDYTTKRGASLYEQGTKALATPFDLKSNQVVIFQKELKDRASMMGWNQGTQGITKFTNKDGEDIDLIDEYGRIDEGTLKTACDEFMTGANSDKRAAQNNEQMWRCIYNTLTEEAKATLLTYSTDYVVQVQGQPKEVGPLMYKTMMRLATLDGNATVQALRANLRELTNYAIKVNGDIDAIHKYFNQNYAQLKSRGKSVDDVHTILFEAYKVVPDANFHAYMDRLYDDWVDQTGDMKDATHEEVMKKAKQRFDLLNHNDKWGAKSPEQEQIIALEAQLKDLKLSKKLLDKLKNKDKDKDKDKDKQKESKGDKQGKNKKNTANKRFQKQDEEWKKTPPKEGEPWVKQVGKKLWYWCIHHMKWCVHKPEDCQLGKQAQTDQAKDAKPQAKQAQTSYAQTLAQIALMAADE